jgi:hypothetical protein
MTLPISAVAQSAAVMNTLNMFETFPPIRFSSYKRSVWLEKIIVVEAHSAVKEGVSQMGIRVGR